VYYVHSHKHNAQTNPHSNAMQAISMIGLSKRQNMRKRTNAVTKLRLGRIARSTRGKTEGMRADRHSAPLARTHLSARRQLVNYRAAVSAPPKARFAKTDFLSKRRVYLNTPMFYCTEINVRTAQLAHETDERTKVGQTKTSLISLLRDTPHINTRNTKIRTIC